MVFFLIILEGHLFKCGLDEKKRKMWLGRENVGANLVNYFVKILYAPATNFTSIY